MISSEDRLPSPFRFCAPPRWNQVSEPSVSPWIVGMPFLLGSCPIIARLSLPLQHLTMDQNLTLR
jgi:hypothetical protein